MSDEYSAIETYWILSDYDGHGGIHRRDGEILLRFRSRRGGMTFVDAAGIDAFEADRERSWTFPSWLVSSPVASTCRLRGRSLWFGAYTLELSGGTQWNIKFPPFTTCYTATSMNGATFRVRLAHHLQWYVEQLSGDGTLPILAAFAVIQKQRQWA